jgi:hypothetical protein
MVSQEAEADIMNSQIHELYYSQLVILKVSFPRIIGITFSQVIIWVQPSCDGRSNRRRHRRQC